jgi:ribosome recycling factor
MKPEEIINKMDKKMMQAIEYLVKELSSIRTGRANSGIVDGLLVDYYGTLTRLQQLANITVPDAKLLMVQPYDQSSIPDIEKAINNSDLGLNPSNDGEVVRIPIPALSEDRRKELSKVASKASEECKVSIRNHRRTSNSEIDSIKKDFSEDEIKRGEKENQEITDKYINKVDEILKQKQDELLEV